MHQITSFLRYPGSKRRFLTFLSPYLPDTNGIKGIYFEPFLGGGAVFFYLNPNKAILSDLNPDLIDLYQGIKESPSKVWKIYSGFGITKSDFHLIRDSYDPSDLLERAARILYLNRTCFKGMWRHNKHGFFNVGYGGQERRWVISEESLIEISSMLNNAEIHCIDFEGIINRSGPGDFLFIDPPYRPGERDQINDHYVGKTFRYDDQMRLAFALDFSKKRGSHWAITNSSHSDIVKMYKGNYLIALPQGTGRQPGVISSDCGEVLITSYEIQNGRLI